MPLIVTLSGSPAPASRTWHLTRDVGRRLTAEGFEVAALDLRSLPAEPLMFGRGDAPDVREAMALVERAQGVVICTPVYKAAYSGLLKAFLDLLPQFGLSGKVVLPLAVGGSIAHVLAIDYGLRPVLCSMAAEHIVAGMFVLSTGLTINEEGGVDISTDVERLLRPVLSDFVTSMRRRFPRPLPEDLAGLAAS